MLTDEERRELERRLMEEHHRRIDAKIEKGEAIRVSPIVVGVNDDRVIERERARRLAALRAAGETGEVYFGGQPTKDGGRDEVEVIITGVARPGRDDIDTPEA